MENVFPENVFDKKVVNTINLNLIIYANSSNKKESQNPPPVYKFKKKEESLHQNQIMPDNSTEFNSMLFTSFFFSSFIY